MFRVKLLDWNLCHSILLTKSFNFMDSTPYALKTTHRRLVGASPPTTSGVNKIGSYQTIRLNVTAYRGIWRYPLSTMVLMMMLKGPAIKDSVIYDRTDFWSSFPYTICLRLEFYERTTFIIYLQWLWNCLEYIWNGLGIFC